MDKKDPQYLTNYYLKSEYNCSECTFLGAQDILEIEPRVPYYCATGLTAIGRTGRTCGAVAGALMAINLKMKRTVISDRGEEYRKVMTTANRFVKKFEARLPAIDCNDITGYDMTNPEENDKYFKDLKARMTCRRYMVVCLEIVKEMQDDGDFNW